MNDDKKIPDERALVPVERAVDTSVILDTTYKAVLEGVTGLAKAKRPDLIGSVGHVLQRARSLGLLDSVKEEWSEYRKKGRITDDYTATEQHRECLQELLDSLDDPGLDEKRFATMKKILLVAATEKRSDRESVIPQQYMRLVRSLGSGEVLVLFTVYERAKEKTWEDKETTNTTSTSVWIRDVAERSGLRYHELVEQHERLLMEKGILTRRVHPDGSGVRLAPHYRLSTLGFELCEFVDSYDGDG